MKNYFLLIIALLSASLSSYSNIHFRHLGKMDGLSQLSVMSICQDELGRMWFGTLEGLNCYDGMRMTTFKYSEQNTLLGNETFNIVSDKQGSLFFTSDSMLIHFDIHQEKFTQLRKKDTNTLFARNNQVWMATNDSIFEWNHSQHQFNYLLSSSTLKSINCLYVDAQEHFWVGTKNGLYRFNTTQQATRPTCIIPHKMIKSLYEDTHNNMWVALYRDGMYKITSGIPFKYSSGGKNSLSNNDIRAFVEDNAGNLWIATFNGLNKLDSQGNFTCHNRDNLPGSLKHSSIFSLYKDVQGTIWLGTFYGGVQYFNPQADLFTHYSENAHRDDCLSFFFVGKMVEDKRGDIWICTDGGGLNKMDRKTKKFTHYVADGKPNSIPFNNLKCIVYDEKQDRLYIGTHTKGFFMLDIPSGKVTCYTDFSKTGNTIIQMLLHKNKLYLSSSHGLFTMDLNTGLITDPVPNQKITIQPNSFLLDSKNDLWVAYSNELIRINLNNPAKIQTYGYEKKGLGKFPITKIIENKQGELFFGTNGSGLFHYESTKDLFVRHITTDGQFQSNYCYDIALSQQGNLILSGEQGITFFNPKQKTSKVIDMDSKLYLSAQNEGCGLLICRNGEIFVGGTDGMTSFMEDNLFSSPPPYNLYFSSIAINNQIVHPKNSKVLESILPFTQKIDLKHNQNHIIITFASNNYIESLQQNDYEYKLEGFDERWISSTDKKIIYTNLNPGNYILMVREKKQGKVTQSIQLKIVIHSPWYATWMAYFVYLLILFAITFFIIKDRRSKMLLQLSLKEEKREKEKSEEIVQAKLQFFSNISHEFRTPLTLIISQIELLLQSQGLTPFVYTRLHKMHRNTFQLRELISELLDFRKMERGAMKLKVSHMNLIPFLKNIHKEFQEQAYLQEIQFHFISEATELSCWYDAKQLKRIIFNLLSNAFKHTPKHGKIDLVIEEQEHCIQLKVIDTGQGISEEALPHIFDRFYQSANSLSQESGTGIGLSLTKGLVSLHHGKIYVHSVLSCGSVFIVELPKENVFTDDEQVSLIEEAEQPIEEIRPLACKTPTVENSFIESQDESNKRCILLVEDNEDMLQILIELLSPLYKIIFALNGKDGLKKVMEEQPDLILSDIMMPIMTGTELCMKVKNNFDLCHIPVILLTALTSEDNKIEGLQCGADDYIGKPFNNKILIGKIAGTLRTRVMLKKKYSNLPTDNSESTAQELVLNVIDKKFLEQLNQLIEAHLSDTELDINTIAKELGIGRSSLYSKLKGLSSMTPNEFVLNFRLKRAADMLKNNSDLQITEIAYQLGFSSLRYFRYCFKAQFNQSPQEYRNK